MKYSQEFIEQDTNTLQFRAVADFFGNKRDGFFIEMGAADGILASNTYRFERDFGWNGILIEPIENYYNDISVNRPTTKFTFNVCVGEIEGSVEFKRIEGNSKLLSGIIDKCSTAHCSRIEREVLAMDQVIHIDSIPCRRMDAILKECDTNHVDYCSIDVEGGELSVLKSISMETSPIRPILFGVENNYNTTEVLDYLAEFGYQRIGSIGGDDFFYRGYP